MAVYVFSSGTLSLTRAIVVLILGLLATNFHDQEDVCILRKGNIILQRRSLLGSPRHLVFTTPPVEVCVQTEELRYVGEGHSVVVRMEDGAEAPLCASCLVGARG